MKEDIGIYTTLEVFANKNFEGIVYWELPFKGMDSLEEMDEEGEVTPKRLWFAFGGFWRGYFEVDRFRGNEIDFDADNWHRLKNHNKYPRTPFRGFTYKVPN